MSDPWYDWLLNRRQGGSDDEYERVMDELRPIRDRVLGNAMIEAGDTMLDVGCGDGLIGLEALYYVGEAGHVIFSDVSSECLEYCAEMAPGANCTFVKAAASNLGAIDDGAVDAVTVRSVLIYVRRKRAAFEEFFRVLAPGGRLSLFEPIERFAWPEREGRFWGYDVEPVAELAEKVKAVYAPDDPMLDFDENDLITLAEEVGFGVINLQLDSRVSHMDEGSVRGDAWQRLLRSAPNPLAPTLAEALRETLPPAEREAFCARLMPQVRLGRRTVRRSLAYLQAIKTT